MTTIAYDVKAGIVAADSQETSDDGHKADCKKLFRVGNSIVATAGGTYMGMVFVEWLNDWVDTDEVDWSERPDYVALDLDEDFECLVIRSDGSCYTVNHLFVAADISGRFVTLGSGAKAAHGAMLAGAGPRKAVNIAKKIDTYTGGRTQTMKVK